jgi:hypothetical protein
VASGVGVGVGVAVGVAGGAVGTMGVGSGLGVAGSGVSVAAVSVGDAGVAGAGVGVAELEQPARATARTTTKPETIELRRDDSLTIPPRSTTDKSRSGRRHAAWADGRDIAAVGQ